MTTSDQVGQRIRDAAERANLSQAELAQKLGLAQNTMSKWMAGKTEITLIDAIKVSAALGVSVAYLAGESQEALSLTDR